MIVRRPEIFISATSADLRSCRALVKEGLLTLGCVPVEQTNFPPDYRTVRAMLRARIETCDAVVHVAGEVYGAEPSVRDPQLPRRSYTQLEYDLALELRKPLYVFLCGVDFPYDEHPAEDPEKQALQVAHRERLRASETLRTHIKSRDELAQRVRELQTKVEHLSRELARSHRWLRRSVVIGVLVLAVLGGTVWTLRRFTRESATQSAELREEVRVLQAVIARFNTQAPGGERMSDDERFDRALAAVAAEYRLEVPALKAKIDAFVAGVRANPEGAGFYDRALADFAEKQFAAAANHAVAAVKVYRSEREAAEREVAASVERAQAARARERAAHTLAGDSQFASGDFAAAQASYHAAAELVGRTENQCAFADVHTTRPGVAGADDDEVTAANLGDRASATDCAREDQRRAAVIHDVGRTGKRDRAAEGGHDAAAAVQRARVGVANTGNGERLGISRCWVCKDEVD